MQKNKWFNLQFFAEGASGGDGGDGAATGVTTADAGQNDTLESMGVPKALADKYRQRKGAAEVPQAVNTAEETKTAAPQQQTATAETETEKTEEQPKAASLKDALKSNPEWNKEMQEIVSNRLKTTKAENAKISQALRLLAANYGVDPNDLEALNSAVLNDKRNFRKAAEDMGTDTDTAKRVWEKEDAADQVKAAARQNIEEMATREHFNKLQAQAQQLQQSIPGFDLSAELNNPRFFAMTSPEGGLSVEEAYYALHHRDVEAAHRAAAQQLANHTAQQTAARVNTAISNSIQAGRSMPQENGSASRAATNLQPKLYQDMTPAERENFKKLARSGRRF